MEKNERISVIVPVYNIEQYLPACIESILAQTYTNLEIILVDDGATDNSGRICDEYAAKDSRIRVIHKPNGGVSSARNAGLDAATGSLIGFVDGDDTIAPEMYQTLYSDMCQYGADIAHCGCEIVWETRAEHRNGTGKILIHHNIQGLQELLSGEKIEPTLWNKLYRIELFGDIRLDERVRVGEDVLINYYLFSRAKKSVFHDVCLYSWIRRDSSCTMGTFEKTDLEALNVSRIILEETKACIPEIYAYGELRLVRSLISTYNHSLKYKRYKNLRKDILAELKEKRNDIFKKDIYSRTQKVAVYMMTICPEIYQLMLRIRNRRYRYRNITKS